MVIRCFCKICHSDVFQVPPFDVIFVLSPPRCMCSSLYYDEDGDLAHEFYEETVVTKNGRKKSKLKRIQKNLIPQVREEIIFLFVWLVGGV